MKQPLVILGATGVGKTAWLLQNFQNRDCVVINVDSVQIYRHFDIGSAKATLEERARLPHVMIDERDPLDAIPVTEYVTQATHYIRQLRTQGKQVIISAGAPYYLKHLLWGAPAVPAVDPIVRERVAAWIQEKGGDYAYWKLQTLDPQATDKFPAGDLYRTSRAWEVYHQTGRLLSSFQNKVGGLAGEFSLIGLDRPRPVMWERSKERVNLMVRRGLATEVQALLAADYSSSPAMQSIGYKEWIEGRKRDWTMTGIEEAIYLHTRQYIKRQMTFFRSFEGVHWFSLGEPQGLDSYLESLSL